ncbi:hypothetical protein DFH09DRAFT_937143 [Mycena vulgaris]|nr:hypothetical protein DFH09DRAFT_948275 [Mycena vulgaris]KAJ6514791.1 hypothetical protein DFH09DRAFT_940827 [Mycena vulgaris]KAJ6524623.1 hypothetical protein DFH09DRAFT_937143 [Mycena vulgaris]
MPAARSPGAPRFDGKEVTAFLTNLVQQGANAGITNLDDLVPYILQYSTDEVRSLIRYAPDFDPEVTGKTWPAAKAELLLLYGHSERVPDYTETMLKDYCQKQSAKSSFTNMSEVETYYRGFAQIAIPLIKKSRITPTERNFYFVAGIPKVIKDWFVLQVPEAKRKRATPPSIAESIAVLQKRFAEDTLVFEPWAEDVTADPVPVQATLTSSVFNIDPPRPLLPTQIPLGTNAMDDLARQIQALTLAMTSGNPQQAQQTQHQGNQGEYPQNTDATQRRCFMCSKYGAHQLGLRHCPETHALLAANAIRYDTNAQRYVLPDGTDLPRIPPGFIGGVADYVRAVARDRVANEIPAARTSAMVLSYGASDVLEGNNFAVSSLDLMSRDADPVTRSGKDTGARFDPAKRPEGKGKERARESPPHMGAGPSSAPAPSAPPVPPAKPAGAQLPSPPTNPINRQDGWRDSRPSNTKTRNEDVVMRDAKKPATGDKYHITSDIQERADAKAVFEDTLQTPVTLPLLQLIGLSPQLQKLFTEATRSKREYDAKSAEYSVRFSDPESETLVYSSNADDYSPRGVYADTSFDEIQTFLVNYGSAIAKVPESRYFAMSTGSINIQIGDVELTAMIDTGSELNLASFSVPSRCNLPVDFEGMKWALKGIHGGPEQLRGCSTDVPIRLGGHTFPHHLFISHQELGHHDMILGQPFLQWFAARLDYERSGEVSMYLWKGGNRKVPPTIMITITDPKDPRNTSSINRSHRATIEEVSDVEDF